VWLPALHGVTRGATASGAAATSAGRVALPIAAVGHESLAEGETRVPSRGSARAAVCAAPARAVCRVAQAAVDRAPVEEAREAAAVKPMAGTMSQRNVHQSPHALSVDDHEVLILAGLVTYRQDQGL